MMKVWTLEQIASSLGCSAQQIHRYCSLDKIPCYRTSTDGLQSTYSFRVTEPDLLDFFGCDSIQQFKALRYH